MAAIDKILKFLTSKNIAEDISEDEHKSIVDDVLIGYRIDEDTRANWLKTNLEAMAIIKQADAPENSNQWEPFDGSAKVIYPLLAPAVIQLASRLIQPIVRNGKVMECTVIGQDQPEIDPQTGQPTGKFVKAEKAKRVSDYGNYTHLIESDTWTKDTHKLCHILASWGTAFRYIDYDPVTKRICDELIAPEDVIINHNLNSLSAARRITVRHSFTKNDIYEQIASGYFLDIDPETLSSSGSTSDGKEAIEEINPVYEVLCQMLYMDLDGDNISEPYNVYVLKEQQVLLGIHPAFGIKEIKIDEATGKILKIEPKLNIIDFHLIDDPQGRFYSIGLNYLLLHTNKAITSILRQLIDSGTLANTQGGFVTTAFKVKENNVRFSMGEFQQLECSPTINPQQHIIPLPFKEPSQVLLALLQMLIDGGKQVGFISDILTGEAEGQNVPATTMLALVEQGTRAFKPVFQKFHIANKKAFKLWFNLNAQYLDAPKYVYFNGGNVQVAQTDFDDDSMDICPVSDPTISSEAEKYARDQFLFQLLQVPTIAGSLNIDAVLLHIFKDMNYPMPEQFIAQQKAPDPALIKIQQQAQKDQMDFKKDILTLQRLSSRDEVDQDKVEAQKQKNLIALAVAEAKKDKLEADAKKDAVQTAIQAERLKIEKFNAETARIKAEQDKKNSNNSTNK